jgi:predicted lipoprotein with Yx(FWY)xxD motif
LIVHKSPKTTPPASTTTSSNTTSQSSSVNNSIVITKSSGSLGSYLADPSGNALYTDGSGTVGVSNCTGSCLSAWPIYQDKSAPTTALPANIGMITRSDNAEVQYTYKGMALYYFASDSNGQVTGNGVSGFSVAKP